MKDNSRNEIVSTIKRRQEVSKQRVKLRDEARKLRVEQSSVNRAFIAGAMDDFINSMRANDYRQVNYVKGGFSDDFTKHVNRNVFKYVGLTGEHDQAVQKYKEALENLNSVFVNAILDDTENCREKILSRGRIKNVAKL